LLDYFFNYFGFLEKFLNTTK